MAQTNILIPGNGRLITVTITETGTTITLGGDSREFTRYNAGAETVSNDSGESADLEHTEAQVLFNQLLTHAPDVIVLA
jgi:hypothetical protein